MNVRIVKNQDVKRVMIAPPTGYRQPRVYIELEEETLIFEEATLANISRALIWILNHPKTRSMEMVMRELEDAERKRGYAAYQLLETTKGEPEIQIEADRIFKLGGGLVPPPEKRP